MNRADRMREAKTAIERISKSYKPNVTSGFDLSNFRILRPLGQGMNGAVSFQISFITKLFSYSKISTNSVQHKKA